MSRRLIYSTFLVFVLCLTTTVVHADIADGLVAYWPLDEGAGTTTSDLSGNGNDGILIGGPNWVEGKLGGALDFDGSDDIVDCGNPPILDFGTGDFTVSAWMRVANVPGGDVTIFSKGGDHSSADLPGVRYQVMLDSSDYIHPVLDDDSSKRDPHGDITVIDGQWHHIVMMRRDGTMFRVYVDGVEDMGVTNHGESTLAADYDLSGTSRFKAYIGAVTDSRDTSGNTLEKLFAGLIDDVAVWNRALTAEEISYLWNDGAGNAAPQAAPTVPFSLGPVEDIELGNDAQVGPDQSSNGSGTGARDIEVRRRVFLISYDISSLKGREDLAEMSFNLVSHNIHGETNVYGVVEDMDLLEVESLTWNTAPGVQNDPTPELAAPVALDMADLTDVLVSFVGPGEALVRFSTDTSDALADFINSDTDGILTFLFAPAAEGNQLIVRARQQALGGTLLEGVTAPINILINGNFETGDTTGWNTYGDASLEVVQDPVSEGAYALRVQNNSVGANFWDAGLQHQGHVFEEGKSYTVSAFMKAEQGTFQLNFKPERGAAPFEAYGEQQFTLTEEWVEYTVATGVIPAEVTPATITWHIAFEAGVFFIDDARFVEVSSQPVPLTASLTGAAAGTDSSATGSATFQPNAEGTAIGYVLTVAGLENTFAAHIHVSTEPGGNGGVVVWLYPAGPPPTSIPGSFTGVLGEGVITADNLAGSLAGQSLDALMLAIQENRAYVNVHTEQFSSGEIRGWLE